MFCVEPWERLIGVKGGCPLESAVFLKLHAEQWIWQAGEVVVVDARVDKGRGKTDLYSIQSCPYQSYMFEIPDLPDIILDGEFAAPERQTWPVMAVDGMIGHRRIHIMLNPGLLGRVGQSLSNGNFISP